MRLKRNEVRKCIVMLLIMCVAIVSPMMIAFAGDINANEARVISAASGTFTYEGKEYRAASSYLNSLVSYLSGDDVDLTAEQADEAISMMYANVAQGVDEGYIYEIGTGKDASTEEGSTTEDDWADAEVEGEKETDKEKADQEKTASNEQNLESVHQQPEDELDVWGAMSNPTENKKKLEERPEKEAASAVVQLEADEIVVTTKNHEEISISKDEPIVSNYVILILTIVSGLVLAITTVCGVILFAKKCLSFKKTKGRKARPGHSKRRIIRRYTRGVLTITTAISLVGITMLLGLYVSLFNDDTIMQNMQSSGYFRYAYSQYIAEQENAVLDSVQNSEGQKETLEIQTYDEYLFIIKQNSLKVLGGDMDIIVPDSNVAPYIYNLKTCYVEIFVKAGIALITSTLLGVFLMVFMDQRRERGVKHIATATLISSGILALLTLIMLVYKPYTLLYIEPDYLYLFLMECVKRCVTALTSITAFSVVMGMLLIGIFKNMMNSKSA